MFVSSRSSAYQHLDVDLAICKAFDLDAAQIKTQIARNLLS
jgi:hypothetical protein